MINISRPTLEKELPEDVVKTIRRKAIPLFKKRLSARKLLPVVNTDMRSREFGYDRTLGGDMQDAQIVAPGGDIPSDSPKGRERILNAIHKIALQYNIPREDYINKNYLTQAVNKAIRKVAEKDNSVIINGEDTAGIPGLVDVPAGSIGPTNGTWDDNSETGATPYQDLVKLLKQLRNQSNGAFGQNPKGLSLVIDPLTETDLYMTHLAETATDTNTMSKIQKLFGQVIICPALTEGDMYLMETGREIGELVIAEDLTVERADYVKKNQTYLGNIYERVLPVWYQHGDTAGKSTAIAELTGV